MYNSRVRNLDIPENLFSNIGELKSKQLAKKENSPKIENESPKDIITDSYQFIPEIKMTNYSNKQEYRERIDKMYEDIKEIIPIDNEIDNVLYFNNYVEKGIVVKPRVASLKQFWTEYRLISNEKAEKNHQYQTLNTENQEKKLDNFDELFEALSERVSEINKYIDELKEMRININEKSEKLVKDKEKLEDERREFNTYKQKEENKINKEKETIKINFARLQTIIDDLDKKLVSIDEEK